MEGITDALFEKGVLGILCVVLVGAITVLWRWANAREDKKEKAHKEEVAALTKAKNECETNCRAEIAGLHRGYQDALREKDAELMTRIEEKNRSLAEREREWAERFTDLRAQVEKAEIEHVRAVKEIYESRLRDKDIAVAAMKELGEATAIALTAGTAAQNSMHQAAQDIRSSIRGMEEELRRYRS